MYNKIIIFITFVLILILGCNSLDKKSNIKDLDKANLNNFDSIIRLNPLKSDSVSLSLLNQVLKSENDSLIVEAYFARTNTLIENGNFEDAYQSNQKCLAICSKNKFLAKELKSKYLMGVINLQEGKLGESAKIFSDLIPELEKEKLFYLLTKAKANLGWSYYNSSQYELALIQIKEALKDAQFYQFEDLYFDYYQRLGSIYAQMKATTNNISFLDSAFSYFKTCESLLQFKNDKSELAFFYENLGNLHNINEAYDSAIVYYLKSAEILKKLNLNLELGYLYSNIGLVYQRIGKYDQSLSYFDLSKNIAEKYNNLDLNSSITKNIAILYENKGDYKMSSKYYSIFNDLYVQKINEEVIKSNNELNTKYQTEKKEKENTALKLEQLKLEKRNISIIWLSASSFVLISLVLWWQFRTRKRKQRIKALEDTQKLEAELSVQRKRFSRDLHDNIGSRTSLLIKNLESLKNEESEDEINKLQNNATDILQNLRETVWAMNEGNISVESLADKITQFAQNRLPIVTTIKLEITQDIYNDKQLSAEDFLNIYRICQESINNSIKYSNGSLLKLNFIFNPDNVLKIEIIDNGKGFDMKFNSTNHYGIQNMKNRAEESQIKFDIDASNGTRISLEKQF